MTYTLAQADAGRLPLGDESADLVFGSPPYLSARLYLEDGKDLGIARGLNEWIDWMLAVTTECLRVSRGPVVWVAAGCTEGRNYQPACEGLMYRWHQMGGHAYRPVYWHRVGIPGSGGDQWFRSDIEHVMCFKRPGALPWSENTAMGQAPKYAPGGALSHRQADGTRRNHWGFTPSLNGSRKPDGSRNPTPAKPVGYDAPVVANPGNLIRTKVGGGTLGHALAHLSEAPFPEALAEFFIRSLCPPGGTVLDPFSGSGTTASVALRFGRNAIGMDLRASQIRLARQRIERPHQPVVKAHKDREDIGPLFAGMEAADA